MATKSTEVQKKDDSAPGGDSAQSILPPEFMTEVVPEYAALQQRLKGAARFSGLSPLQPIIDLDRLELAPAELFERILGDLDEVILPRMLRRKLAAAFRLPLEPVAMSCLQWVMWESSNHTKNEDVLRASEKDPIDSAPVSRLP